MVQRALSSSSSSSVWSASPNRSANKIPSLGFSGAGFLGVYHLGVWACFLEQGLILAPGEVTASASASTSTTVPTILSGVSAGSIVAAGIASGIHPDDGMNLILTVSQRTRGKTSKLMDVLTPRFSLIDQVEDLLRVEMKKALGGTDEANGYDDYDVDLLLRRTEGGSLRIGLMDRRQLSRVVTTYEVYVPEAYVYVNQFRNVEDVVAASVLSSFLPGLTGPLQGSNCPHNASVQRASRQLSQLMRAIPHAIRQEGSHQPVDILSHDHNDDDKDNNNGDDDNDDVPYTHFYDGGLAHLFPIVNDSTIIVSPFNGIFSNPCICPPMPTASNANSTSSNEQSVAREAKRFLDSIMEQFGRGTSNVVDQKENKGPHEAPPPQEPEKRSRTTNNRTSTALPSFPSTIRVSPVAELGLNLDNLETMRRMALSSDDATMEAYYEKGYTNAKHFLRENHLLTKFSSIRAVPQ